MDTAVIVALITGSFAFLTTVITLIVNVTSNNKVQREIEKQKRDDSQAEALELCLRSNWFTLHALHQLKNDEGKPLINGESVELCKEIENFQKKKMRESL